MHYGHEHREGMLQDHGMLDKSLFPICIEDVEYFSMDQKSFKSEFSTRSYGFSKFAFISVKS